MTKEEPQEEPREARAEELIVSIYSQVQELRAAGRAPGRVVMSLRSYRRIQEYRAHLGELPDGRPDYLGRYELFGLPVLIDEGEGCHVLE